VRSILWYDWPYVFKHRRQLTCLDNILLLTHGRPFTLTHLLLAIRPADHLYTGVYQSSDGGDKSVGQVYQSAKVNSAHINYLLHPEDADPQSLVPLLEGLVKQAGNWGAKQVVADLDTGSPWFVSFRQAGFSVLAKQQVFKCLIPAKVAANGENRWRRWTSADIHAMRCLYHTLVPPLVQPVEPLTRRETLGLVYYDEKGDLGAYADLVYGPFGIWVLPVILPQAKEEIAGLLMEMILAVPDRADRSVYVTTRSYQPWVEHALLDLSAEPGPEQALLVRYIALQQRVKAEFSFAAIENGNREPTVPYAPIKNHRD
jgi:hypothetical protein